MKTALNLDPGRWGASLRGSVTLLYHFHSDSRCVTFPSGIFPADFFLLFHYNFRLKVNRGR